MSATQPVHPPLERPPALPVEGLSAISSTMSPARSGLPALSKWSIAALHLLVGAEPPARTHVQGGHLSRGPACQESVTEKIPEEVVVTEPLALLVQGDHEEVGVLQPLQRRLFPPRPPATPRP